jgi:YD repeat-containing protein
MTSSVQAYRGGGHWVSFSKTGTNYVTDAKVIDAVFQISAGWRYIDKLGLAYETYDSAGRIQRVDYANGGSLDYSYSTANTPASQASSPGLLTSITSDKTRSINISYDSSNRVYQITTPQRRFIGFNYTLSNSLHQIQWPDGTMRRFAYERPDLPWALTGVFNETGARHSTFSYDAAGLAIGTALQADPNTRVDEFGVTFSGPVPAWSVTETFDSKTGILWRDHYLNAAPSLTLEGPTGSTSTMTGISVLGSPRLTGQSQPAGSGCTASTSAQSYDANGNIASHNDFNGYRTCYANNLSRNLETSRVEGLASDASCEVTAASAAPPAGSRKTSTQWHPDWSLIVKQAEPGRFTTSVYNGQLDPFAGGTTASCAPASATLPDGKPIVVLCRQVEQATTDFDGSQGFSAAVEAGTPAREQRWTYNAVGQVLTAKGPRTDINDTTTYAYYSDTAFTGADPNAVGHTLGDLLQTTNPAGHVTRYTKYNKTGQVLEMIDPNGIVTANAYDARQRLISTSVGGQASTYEYWPTGLLKMATQPDGSYLSYAYDDAHRLIQVGDQLGNSVSYTLDNMGKRTAESVRDPSGILRHALSRSIDALGRVQQLTGRPQ